MKFILIYILGSLKDYEIHGASPEFSNMRRKLFAWEKVYQLTSQGTRNIGSSKFSTRVLDAETLLVGTGAAGLEHVSINS